MSLISKLFKKPKLHTEVKFSEVAYTTNTVLESNTGRLNKPSWENVCEYLKIMFSDEEQFVTLTLECARFGIRYMQSCRIPSGITVQLGLEKDDKTTLVEKTCDERTTMALFDKFYNYGVVDQMETFKPVKFYK